MSELHDRLNALAERGTPRGADAVFEAAAREVSLGVIEGERADGPDAIPFVTAEPRPERRRGRIGTLVAAAGMASLLVVGMLAISALVGSGGANSPEGAVRRLATAIENEDPIAAADVLAPSEVRSLASTFDAAARKAAENDLVESASAPLKGLDLSVDNLDLAVQPLADGYAKVIVEHGTITSKTEREKFASLMRRNFSEATSENDADLSQLASSMDMQTFVVTVREDGKWYVSAAYTTLEYIKASNDVDAKVEYGAGKAAVAQLGADTPDAAVEDALRALAANDWDRLFSLALPDEIPVYDYRNALKEIFAENGSATDFTIDRLETTSETHGNEADVLLRAGGKSPGGTWTVEGACFTSTDAESAVESGTCIGESPYSGGVSLGILFPADIDTELKAKDTKIKTVQRNGRWFVSGSGTVLDLIDQWIQNLDRRDLYEMFGVADLLPPDGALTLGEPLRFDESSQHLRVLTFDGRAGQRLIGLAQPRIVDKDLERYFAADVRVTAPNGERLDESWGILSYAPLTLPVDGTYVVVVRGYGFGTGGTVTIWDEDDAPAEAREAPSYSYEDSVVGACSDDGTGVPGLTFPKGEGPCGTVAVPTTMAAAGTGSPPPPVDD